MDKTQAMILWKLSRLLKQCDLWENPKIAQAAQLLSEVSWEIHPSEFGPDDDGLPTQDELQKLFS